MLARLAWRLTAIEALKDRTDVGSNVLDSEIGALDISADGTIRSAQEKPFVSVYTDAAKIETGLDLRALYRNGQTDLTIEAGVTASMAVTDPETGASEIMTGLAATDAALEFVLDRLGRQVVDALLDPINPWAEIWRGLSSRIVRIERRRASDATGGARIAAHQIVVTADLMADPPRGEPLAPESVWARLFARMKTSGHPYHDRMLELVGTPSGVRAHEAQRRRFGMTIDEARALLDIAVRPAEATEPNIESVSVERTV